MSGLICDVLSDLGWQPGFCRSEKEEKQETKVAYQEDPEARSFLEKLLWGTEVGGAVGCGKSSKSIVNDSVKEGNLKKLSDMALYGSLSERILAMGGLGDLALIDKGKAPAIKNILIKVLAETEKGPTSNLSQEATLEVRIFALSILIKTVKGKTPKEMGLSYNEMYQTAGDIILEVLADKDEEARADAAVVLIRIWLRSTPEAKANMINSVISFFKDKNEKVRISAFRILEYFPGSDVSLADKIKVARQLIAKISECREIDCPEALILALFAKSENAPLELKIKMVEMLFDAQRELKARNQYELARLNIDFILEALAGSNIPSELKDKIEKTREEKQEKPADVKEGPKTSKPIITPPPVDTSTEVEIEWEKARKHINDMGNEREQVHMAAAEALTEIIITTKSSALRAKIVDQLINVLENKAGLLGISSIRRQGAAFVLGNSIGKRGFFKVYTATVPIPLELEEKTARALKNALRDRDGNVKDVAIVALLPFITLKISEEVKNEMVDSLIEILENDSSSETNKEMALNTLSYWAEYKTLISPQLKAKIQKALEKAKEK